MFSYCRNNPVKRKDVTGASDVCYVKGFDDNPFNDWEYLVGGGGGGVGSAIASVAVVVAIDATEKDKAKTEVLSLTQTQSGQYTVYFLCAKDDVGKTIIYVGRVKTANFDARMAYHNSRGRLLVNRIDGLNYEACRAIEQAGMIYYHTINREAALNNQIRGVGPLNRNRLIYLAAMQLLVNSGMYTGEDCIPASYLLNLTEEMFLNGTP